MYEKVNPSHPDKIADRIAGALVDMAYKKKNEPHVAVEVLIGHGKCTIINETDTPLDTDEINAAVKRITRIESILVDYTEVKQDDNLNKAQICGVVCGDNGIFCGKPMTSEQKELARISSAIYDMVSEDGKYIYDEKDKRMVVCQSNMDVADYKEISRWLNEYQLTVNPLGDWDGGINVDTGATNRKLGSDMGDAVTGGGLHGKDLSKADVSVNVYLHLISQKTKKSSYAYCAIGDNEVNVNGGLIPYNEIVESARVFIEEMGGFEKFAEWGLIR